MIWKRSVDTNNAHFSSKLMAWDEAEGDERVMSGASLASSIIHQCYPPCSTNLIECQAQHIHKPARKIWINLASCSRFSFIHFGINFEWNFNAQLVFCLPSLSRDKLLSAQLKGFGMYQLSQLDLPIQVLPKTFAIWFSDDELLSAKSFKWKQMRQIELISVSDGSS